MSLSIAPVKRQLKKGGETQIENIRISTPAAKAGVMSANQMLEDIAAKAVSLLSVSKTKTVTRELLLHIVKTDMGMTVNCDSVREAQAPAKGKRGPIATATVVSAFRSYLPRGSGKAGIRVSADARAPLVAITVSYLRKLGAASSGYTAAAARKTMSGNDIERGLTCLA